MHNTDSVAILARADRVGRPLTSWSAASLWRLCSAAGVTLTPEACGLLRVDGPRTAVSRLAPALAIRKGALMRGACTACRTELATKPPAHCRWCYVLRNKRYTYDPGSVTEERFLDALASTNEESRPQDDVTIPENRMAAREH